MSRWQAEQQAEREIASLDRDYENGLLTSAEHRKAVREIENDMRAAYEDDMFAAQQAVKDEWGW